MADDSNLDAPVTWFSAWNYPTRVTEELSVSIAERILHGSSVMSACMAVGVAPSRARQWLTWGEEAYRRDAGPHDTSAPYLDFFLKVMQAAGLAGSIAQRTAFHLDARYWLSHSPEQRGDWGAATTPISPLLPAGAAVEAEVGDASAAVTLPVPDATTVRETLRTLYDIGAAVPGAVGTGDDERVVDADNTDSDSAGDSPPGHEALG